MTAVASPPSFANLNRPGWINGGQSLNSMNPDELRGVNMFMPPRKTMQRTNSSSSLSSNASSSSTSTVTSNASANGGSMPASGDLSGWSTAGPRKRQQPKGGQWAAGKPEGQADFSRAPAGRPPMANGVNGVSTLHQPSPIAASNGQPVAQNGMPRPGTENLGPGRQPLLCLLSLNGTFERKTISVPFYPDTLRIGRQTNAKTVPTPSNGFFDSKVLSRQHAEIWADANGKIFIRDVKSSNGTFVNSTRLSQENRESEPHELMNQDHLELGIDIVSEDQKTVVHHKVSAKVEHAGFPSPSNNLLEMNFGDLDPSNGGMIPFGGMPLRGRFGSQSSLGSNGGRMPPGNMMAAQANGMAHQRQFWVTPPTTENIIKRLHNEMRTARLQNDELKRTGQFISALLSKDDIKNQEKPETAEPQKNHVVNGNALSFRSDGGKTRFSDPPAPPPSQPLPEKPDVARSHSDVPSLKRGTTERPKSNPPNNASSPVRQENSAQHLQLMEMLATARKEADSHSARVRDLEEMLQKEREARLQAEDMVHKLEESGHAKTNGVAVPPLSNADIELDKTFEPPVERPLTPEPSVTQESADGQSVQQSSPPQVDQAEASAAAFQARIESMLLEMRGLKEQLDAFRQRAELAEAERDHCTVKLADLVEQINRRNEEEKRQAERKSRSRSKRGRSRSRALDQEKAELQASPARMNGSVPGHEAEAEAEKGGEDAADEARLSRANTITPSMESAAGKAAQDQALIRGLPYASMIGVVLLGMGLMAYLNGWQAQPPRLER